MALQAPPVMPLSPDQWHQLRMVMEGDHLTVEIDGTLVCDYRDAMPLPAGRIGLQHNQGKLRSRIFAFARSA